MNQIQKHNLHNIKRSFEKRTGTRLLPYLHSDSSDESDRNVSKRHMRLVITVVSVLLCVIALAVSFPHLRNGFHTKDSKGALPSISVSQPPSDDTVLESVPETTPPENQITENRNLQIARQSDGAKIIKTVSVTDELSINIDAVVNTANVERVSMYRCVPLQITDEQRTAVFEAYFGERADEVFHYTYGNADSWHLETENELYRFGYSRQLSPVDQQICFLHNTYSGHNPLDMLSSLDEVEFPLSNAFEKCERILNALVPGVTYEPYTLKPFGCIEPEDGNWYWIHYRRIVDGMPLVTGIDKRFFVSEQEIVMMHWTLYDLEDLSLTQNIISVDDALQILEENPSKLDTNVLNSDMPENGLNVTEITLEYIALHGANGVVNMVVPAWRFLLGENEEQRGMYKGTVIAVNALTGEIITTWRGRNL